MCMPMLGLLTWAAAIDMRCRRIPNWLTLSLVLSGLAQSWTWAHTVSPGQSFLGLSAGFGLTFVLFGIGALGGGDVKLLAGLGAWLGPVPTLLVFAVAAVIGMVYVLAQAAGQGRLSALFRNSAVIAMSLAHAGEIRAGAGRRDRARRVPAAPAGRCRTRCRCCWRRCSWSSGCGVSRMRTAPMTRMRHFRDGLAGRRRRRRRGNATLEMVLVLGILLSLTFGAVEFGHSSS